MAGQSGWVISDFASQAFNSKTNISQSNNNESLNNSSRGIKRKQGPSPPSFSPTPSPSSSQLSQSQTSKTQSNKSSFGRKTSFTKSPSFDALLARPSRDELWADKHAPTNSDSLAVHAKKVAEVKQWIQSYLSVGHQRGAGVSPFLLLTGPSGCGKSATVIALAHDLRIRVIEWTNPMDTRSHQEEREMDEMLRGRYWDPTESTFQPSQINAFSDFVLKANKYQSLSIGGSSQSSSSSASLILIDDFPNAFFRDPKPFHDMLANYAKRRSPHPLVFVVSDANTSKSSSDSIMLKLFPKDVQSRLDFSVISFNAVANTFVTACLKKISTREAAVDSSISTASSMTIEAIVANAAGDLRAAINNLQFQSFRVTSSALKESITKSQPSGNKRISKPQTKSKSGAKASESGQRDSSLFLFHALGKILHCKREAGSSQDERPLPFHLSHLFRDHLQFVPEDVVAKTSVSPDFFNLFLHQNYLEYYTKVNDVVAASDCLSLADTLASDWSIRSVMAGYDSSLATRGIVFHNSDKATISSSSASSSSSGRGGFRPMRKPQRFDVWRRRRDRLADLATLFRELRQSPAQLATTTLPVIKNLGQSLPLQTQNALMRDIAIFPRRSGGSVSHLESLRDNDVVGEDEDEGNVDGTGAASGAWRGAIQLPSIEGSVKEEGGSDLAQYDDEAVDIENIVE